METLELTTWCLLVACLITHYQMRRAWRLNEQARQILKDVALERAGLDLLAEQINTTAESVEKAKRELYEFHGLMELGMREEALELAREAGFTVIGKS